MRRKEKAITDNQKINQIIDACNCCRLGLCDEGEVYIVPLNFGYTYDDATETRVLYFHGCYDGRKMELLKKSKQASFEMDTAYQLMEAESACKHTAHFQSIMGVGDVAFIESAADKETALNIIMNNITKQNKAWQFADGMIKATCVFTITIKKLTCKENM